VPRCSFLNGTAKFNWPQGTVKEGSFVQVHSFVHFVLVASFCTLSTQNYIYTYTMLLATLVFILEAAWAKMNDGESMFYSNPAIFT
jgi:hypothetical protein